MTELASVLNKTKHSIYKKVQGDIGLSLDEIIRLAEHYDLRLDPLLRPDTALSFEFAPTYAPSREAQYLDAIEAQLERVAALPGIVFWCSGIELPFIHNYNFPRLTAFKFFMHRRTFRNQDGGTTDCFNLQDFLSRPVFTKPMHRILDLYYTVPSVEFWNSMILDITLNQIRYTLESGLFRHADDALMLCDDLALFLDHTEHMAARGVKINAHNGSAGAQFDLFQNEIAHSNNLIMASSARTEYLFLSFGNPHYMYTTTERAVDYTRQWFLCLQQQSQRVSRAPLKVRAAFFNQLRKRIAITRNQLEAFITLHM
ncbi:MAG: hypothetical protein R3330_01455 [Saprospiraceae bacterium]|nr:hypothetical protein [Saprospiraceae bacterium]